MPPHETETGQVIRRVHGPGCYLGRHLAVEAFCAPRNSVLKLRKPA